MKNVLVLLYVVFAFGCASVKTAYVFDGKTAESTKYSIAYVAKGLKPQQQIEFLTALMAIQFYDVQSASEVIDNPAMSQDLNYALIGKKIDGLTYNEVLALAKTSPTKVSITQ